MHAICWVKRRLFWSYYCVTYNFIQNHNQCRDLHQFFSCLFETFGSMSEIMFSNDSMSKNIFSTAENTWMSTFVFSIIGKQWFTNVRLTVIFLIYHFWYQLLSIVIYIQAILDFQNNLYIQETRQTNSWISCHLWKKKQSSSSKGPFFTVKSKLQKPFWQQSYGINLEKVNFFILEQIRIIEFCPFYH